METPAASAIFRSAKNLIKHVFMAYIEDFVLKIRGEIFLNSLAFRTIIITAYMSNFAEFLKTFLIFENF